MQRIIKGRQVVNDNWHLLPKETAFEDVPNSDSVIVPANLWLEHGHALTLRDGGLGVWLDSDEEPESIADALEHFQVIAINFPAFTDGRGFSYARLLRERFGYKGELRAIGDVLQDQLFFMQRCGFDAYAIRADRDPETALAGLDDFTVTYQAAADQPQPLFRRRLA
ncbi:uncharacterized protein (DUF934 family) [Pseudomonas duriflava]|uniref:Uncharacterized protein (DUF934 family) n=1 Tax=Pseudomonas duriflava TaxID=459528 RepID=A0A562Q8T8_9PSED|nr:DUF934 domain-containing protein [Pseudomonas duriflava]TWI53175.1 uncharacterized protein (DUF934 family) [Pseudomonas duriflava]